MVRKKRKFDFTPSPYQEKIFDFVEHGVGNAVIKACAGSGKTKTIVSAIQLIPKSKKCLFIAFNRAIASELKEKVKSNSNCDVRTIHSLGYLMLRRNFGNEVEIDEYKYRSYIKNHISELSSINDEFVMSPDSIREYIDNIATLVDYARFNLAQSVLDIEGIADKYSIPVSFDECEVAKKCMEWGRDNHMIVDYTDMVWLPTELSLRPMGLQFDWILFDECQDASMMSIQLFLKCFKRGTRFIAVGDSDQCIYYFAGSSTEAFDYMCNYPNTTVFPLPITYRCSKVITEFAQQIVPEITARDDAPEGEIIYDCPISMINDGDMVLCRSKAPLVQLYTKLLRRNITCYIKGQDMGANLIKMIEDIDCEKLNAGLQDDGLFVRLFIRLFEERDKMMAKRNINLSDASLSMYIMSMYDSINTLSILAERCRNKKELIRHIEQIFKEDSEGVCLSTIHKAKGLENDNVYILCNSSMPSKLAKKEWEKRQERNIQYVAYTRAKQRMGFVSENEISPSGSISEPIAILNDLHNIELQLQRITGRKPTEDSTNIKLTEFRLKNVTKVDENVNNDNVVELTQEENDDKSINNDDILLQLADFLKKDDGNIDKLKKFLNS